MYRKNRMTPVISLCQELQSGIYAAFGHRLGFTSGCGHCGHCEQSERLLFAAVAEIDSNWLRTNG